MPMFTIEVAGLVVCVQPLFQSTREYCLPFLTNKVPDLFVRITRDDLVFEQTMLEREAIEEGLKIRKFKDPFLERATIQRRIAEYLLTRNTLMMHGSTIAVDGRAYLFTAPCGTGKSTHTKLWRELFGERAIMVNDDKPFLQITSSDVLAYGSPWSGKHGLASNVCVPLKGICLLHRGNENVIRPIGANSIVDVLYKQVYSLADGSLTQNALALVDTLVEMVPLWDMHCNKELDAAKVACCAMSCDCERST